MKKVSTIICGHRGGGGDPESLEDLLSAPDRARGLDHYALRDLWGNRLATFEYMMAKGVTCFELDLLRCKDGDAIVVHNSLIDGSKAWELSSEDLQKKGCCTLEKLLNAVEKFQTQTKKKVTLLLEVKGSVSSETLTDIGQDGVSEHSNILINKLVSIIRERVTKHDWQYEQLPIIGFNHSMLAIAKSLDSAIQIGLSYSRESFDLNEKQMNSPATPSVRLEKACHTHESGYPPKKRFISRLVGALIDSRFRGNDNLSKLFTRMIEDAKKAGAYAIIPDDRFVNRELVESAHAAGLKVESWTSYRVKPRPKEMIALGVDTLITDCPLEAAKLLSAST